MAQGEHKIENLLLLVDESPGSLRSVEYTGKVPYVVGAFDSTFYTCCRHRRRNCSNLVERKTAKRTALEDQLWQDQQQWISRYAKSAKPWLEKAPAALRKVRILSKHPS